MDVPSCSSKQIIRVALHLGFVIKGGGKGSHTKLEHPGSGRVVIVPETKDVGRGLRTRILKDLSAVSGKPLEEVIPMLGMTGFFLVELFRRWFER